MSRKTRLAVLLSSISSNALYSVLGYVPGTVADFKNNFYSGGSFDDLLTHIRSSNATMTDSDGLIKWAPHNLLLYSEDFTAANWSKLDVTVTPNSTTAPDGTNTATKVEFSGGQTDRVTQIVSFTSNLPYTFSVWLKGTQNDTVFIEADTVTKEVTLTGDWQLESVTAPTFGSTLQIVRIITRTGTASEVYVWGAHLYRSDLNGMVNNPDRGDSYVPTTTAVRYLPRRNHYVFNGVENVNEGIFIESEARTNLFTYSNDFSQWSESGVGALSALTESPIGAESAQLIEDDEAGGTGVVTLFQNVTLGSSIPHTFSVFAKASEVNYLFMYTLQFDAAVNGGSVFDLSDGTFTANSSHKCTVQPYGDGWYRISITFTPETDLAGRVALYLSDDGSSITPAKDGTTSVIIAGAQLEVGATPSSYIPTVGATGTRAAEALTIPAANLPWPEPVVIGDELVTNGTFDDGLTSWTSGAFDSATLEGGGVRIERDGVIINSALIQSNVYETGKVYQISYDILDGNANSGNAILFEGLSNGISTGSVVGSYSFVGVGTGTSLIARCYDGNFAVLDNISVQEINPLSVSLQMDGQMTYADIDNSVNVLFLDWAIDSSNYIKSRLNTSSTRTGEFNTYQAYLGTVDIAFSSSTYYSPGILVPFNIASRHGSTFVNGAVDGTALTVDQTPIALPDLSSTDLDIASVFMGTIKTLRVWADDIGDLGIGAVSE